MNRRQLLASLSASLLAQPLRAQTPRPSARVVVAKDIKLGINIHPSYGDPPEVLRAMRAVGFTRYRMDATRSPLNAALAAQGMRGDFIISDGPGDDRQLGIVRALAKQYPGSVEFVEGRNEVNNHRTDFQGLHDSVGSDVSQRNAIRAYMDELSRNVRTDPLLSGVRVIDHSDLHPLFATGDFVNDHIYDNGANRSLAWWAPHEAELMAHAAPNKPMAVTEWGFRTGGAMALSSQQQAASIIEGVAELLLSGVELSYLYALRDDNEPYGVFAADWSPKPAVAALSTLARLVGGDAHTEQAAPSPLVAAASTKQVYIVTGPGRGIHMVWRSGAVKSEALSWTYARTDMTFKVKPEMLISSTSTLFGEDVAVRQSGRGGSLEAYTDGVLVLSLSA